MRTGRFAANFFTVFATHDGCLYRKFKVEPGKLVRASVWCMNVTNSRTGQDGGHGMRVGIDPTGSQDHTGVSVVYGDWWSIYMEDSQEREWRQVTVETIAQSDEITVFLHAKCDFPAAINASHWDDFMLEVGEVDEATELAEPEAPGAPAGYPTLDEIEQMVRRVVREELSNLQD